MAVRWKNDGSTNSDRGTVTVTGTVDSGNSYKRVSSGLEGWTDFVKSYYDEVMRTVPTYTLRSGAEKSSANVSSPRYILNSDGTVSRITSGQGYEESDLLATGKTITLSSYDKLSDSQKSNLSSYLAAQSITWAGAKAMAQGATKGTDNTGDTYLATITTALENSLASPAEEYQLIVGGRGSGNNKNNPADEQYPYGYYWVTGPEGMANNGKGTKFANNDGSAVNNYYVKWNSSYSQHTHATEKEPNNSGPMVSIGFGTASNWDDVSENATTIRGFVQEKNLAHSGLIINAGDSKVDIAGNLGNSVALKNVEINAGDVAIGSGIHYTGIVHSDEGVSITGKNVTVGDRITADTKGVDIQATGDIHVDGITSHENINLTTTDGSIVLDKEHNDGSLHTDSQDNDAVVIDLKGKNASFKNDTNKSKPAITTGKDGGWKIYAYSPKSGDFGTNLNSKTNAQWNADSTSYAADTDTESAGKYIFQVQPTITVKAADMTKVYGETMTGGDVTTKTSASFVAQDETPHDVNDYKAMFDEGDLTRYYNNQDISFASEGFDKKATRDGGKDNSPVYEIKASREGDGLSNLGRDSGYAPVAVEGGKVKIWKRQINVYGSGSQTYGDSTIRDWNLTADLTGKQAGVTGPAIVEGDRLDDSTGILSIKSGSAYDANQTGRQTADASEKPYEDAVDMTKVGFTGNAGINYEIVEATGNLTVNKAALHIHTGDIYTTYGTVKTATSAVDGLVNGDEKTGLAIGYGDYGEAYLDGNTRTNVPGQYAFHALFEDPGFLKNYVVTNDDATVTIDMAQRKPDIDAHEPTNATGSASYTSNLDGRQGVPGVDRVAGLTDAQLPFFRVEAGKVTQYGTYDVTETPSEVRLQPTGKRLPEPNQPKTQYREYTKTLTTADGSGQFLMTYDGSTFRIEPTDGAALALVRAGDAKHNVDLAAKALHVGFSEMGLVLESLDAVYVCLDGHSQTGSDELA